jgi:hypothetical protein
MKVPEPISNPLTSLSQGTTLRYQGYYFAPVGSAGAVMIVQLKTLDVGFEPQRGSKVQQQMELHDSGRRAASQLHSMPRRSPPGAR